MHLIIKISFVTFFLISIGCKNRSNKRFPEITLSETLFTIDDSSWHIELPVSSVYQGGIYSYDTVSNLVIFFNGERKIILIDISNKKTVCEYALDQNYLYTNVRIKKKIGSYSFKSNNKIFILISADGKGIINITDSIAKYETKYFNLRESFFDIDISSKSDKSIKINTFNSSSKNVINSFTLQNPVYQNVDTINFSFEVYTKLHPPS